MSSVPSTLSFADARHAVESAAAAVPRPDSEILELLSCAGRVLAEAIAADRDFPPFPRATRDGFAVRASDVAQCPARLRVIAEIRAGGPEQGVVLRSGEAAEIMTGAPAPSGSDAIVMVEYTAREGEYVIVQRTVAAGENIVPPGSEARAGDALLCPRTRLTPAALSLAASVGRTHLAVYRRPRVAILSTGDELVDVAATPGANQIRNSNSYALAAQIEAAGGAPAILPIAPDEPVQLRHLIEEGLRADLLLLSGGVSMGKYDLVEQVLQELGAEFIFTGALIQPGKPIVFGRAAHAPGATPTYFFGLPGNPVSTMVTFELFATAMLDALAGASPRPLMFPRARLKAEVKVKPGLTRFLPAILSGEFDRAEVELVKWQGSGDMASTAKANCFLVVPPDRERLEAGEWISILAI